MFSKWTNLASRSNDFCMVVLDFRKDSLTSEVEIRVTVNEKGSGNDFTLYPHPCDALQCFNHPYASRDRVLASGRYSTAS